MADGKTEQVVPWIAVALSAIAAVGGLWSAWEAHSQARTSAAEAALDNEAALVRYCDSATPALFRTGDDTLELTGSDGDDEYTSSLESVDFADVTSKKPKSFLRCRFTNYSRVPLLSINFYMRVGFHHGRTTKWEHGFAFELAPGETHAVWILNTDNDAITVRVPERTQYVRFPLLNNYQNRVFQPLLRDYWILRRSRDPDGNLDNA